MDRSRFKKSSSSSLDGNRVFKAKAKSAKATARVQTDVLMAIKPVHLANIASREKNHEYHKYRLKDGVERLWLYETSDGRRDTSPLGIGNADFNAGLKESKYGYPVLELYELVSPVSLDEMKSRWAMGGAPMGWQ